MIDVKKFKSTYSSLQCCIASYLSSIIRDMRLGRCYSKSYETVRILNAYNFILKEFVGNTIHIIIDESQFTDGVCQLSINISVGDVTYEVETTLTITNGVIDYSKLYDVLRYNQWLSQLNARIINKNNSIYIYMDRPSEEGEVNDVVFYNITVPQTRIEIDSNDKHDCISNDNLDKILNSIKIHCKIC